MLQGFRWKLFNRYLIRPPSLAGGRVLGEARLATAQERSAPGMCEVFAVTLTYLPTRGGGGGAGVSGGAGRQ